LKRERGREQAALHWSLFKVYMEGGKWKEGDAGCGDSINQNDFGNFK